MSINKSHRKTGFEPGPSGFEIGCSTTELERIAEGRDQKLQLYKTYIGISIGISISRISEKCDERTQKHTG